ncbi:MAG: proton-conducting transporter membrane subunit [Geminicoccaceae bacterium]
MTGGTGGWLLVLALALPSVAALIAIGLGGRWPERIALVVMPVGLVIALAITTAVLWSGDAVTYVLGSWLPPLGIALRADGLSAAMLLTSAVVLAAVTLFAREDFCTPAGVAEARAPMAFWTLLLALWAALDLVFLADDLFSLFVALELLTFAAVPLVCLDGSPGTIAAALRYLLFALLGSMLYLLGAGLIYGAHGTLDIVLLSKAIAPTPAILLACCLMTVGLLAKAALFPLHLWLPPAHAGAPAPASAILSALVVKAPLFLIVRLWFDVMPGIPGFAAGQVLGVLGAAAILFGGVLALRQQRLKLLVAYSTVAQIGYLFILFPLVQLGSPAAWVGGILQVVSHAIAKAAMFLAAGLIAQRLGHDRIGELGGIGRALPMTTLAFGLAGLSLMGLPPSGGFIAKWLLLQTSLQTGQWWWALPLLLGALLTGGYLLRVLAPSLAGGGTITEPVAPVTRRREAVVLVLAAGSVALGLVPLASFNLVQVGRLALPAVLGP